MFDRCDIRNATCAGLAPAPQQASARPSSGRALDAAADAEAKRDAHIMLQDVQGKMLQYGEEHWRATVQHSWESLQDGGAGVYRRCQQRVLGSITIQCTLIWHVLLCDACDHELHSCLFCCRDSP